MSRPSADARPVSPVRAAAAVYVAAVAVNSPWELLQSPLYLGMGGWDEMWWHCLRAALGDGVLVLVIYAAGLPVFRRSLWFAAPGARGLALTAAAGLVLAVAVEWVAIRGLDRWAYGPRMPVLAGLGVGLVPVAQMLALPPLAFRLAAALFRHGSSNQRRNSGMNVVRTVVVAIVAISALALAACGGRSGELREVKQQKAGEYTIVLLAPEGRIEEGTGEFALEFRGPNGQPVDVGEVQLTSSMPMPGQPNMLAAVSVSKTATPGRYTVSGDFEMKGAYDTVITFANGQKATVTLKVQ